MKPTWRGILALSGCLIVLALMGLTNGCVVHGHGDVEVVDEHGYHHNGYYDEHHDWHGGYYDEDHHYHDDPHDWHHD